MAMCARCMKKIPGLKPANCVIFKDDTILGGVLGVKKHFICEECGEELKEWFKAKKE